MAIIKELVKTNATLKNISKVSADYYYDKSLFQIRTYKAGVNDRKEGILNKIFNLI